ncbi:DNA starvation/stationary phase protection protein [Leptolyngbya sp. FACHB-36]|uniref:Dps family protein n=1 Tax=Leptolyngbya sp. FACHB-36 TaxID=2692808 RepID=UPI001681B404|nr:Dps family protein [Leptolyngbya sp. FACHB-36]MBD2020946.1 DNA starvation/stationary phase protection protein [Leptolyngbya sp. FACHB-36]
MRKLNIGLSEEQRNGVCGLLNTDLANSYLLQIKTKKYHWDVTGPEFRSLHQLWEEQYQTLSESIDAIAERVRQLGNFPVGTAEGFLRFGSIKEHTGNVPPARQMVTNLIEDHETIIRGLREHIDQCSEEFHDEGTADFLTGLMEGHEEMAWMLRSFIDGIAIEPDGKLPQEDVKFPVGAAGN